MKRGFQPGWFLLGASIFIGSQAQAVQRVPPSSPQELLGLGLVVGDPEGWGITGKIWLDHEVAIQPAVKFGYSEEVALQCDLLWHNYQWIPAADDSWPVYIGAGAQADSYGSAAGVRGVLGVSYIFKDLPGDFYVQLVPAYWFQGPGPAFQIYGEMGSRLYL
jgi:hypothetical protein